MPVTIHGNEYLTVAERVNQIHRDHKGLVSITTEVLKFDDEKAMVKATVIIYDSSDAGDIGRIFAGHAFERADASRINATSYLEVCETSAIGRALAAASYGGSEFASADEVANAISEQSRSIPKTKVTEVRNSPPPAPASVSGGTGPAPASPKSYAFMLRLMKETKWEELDLIVDIKNKIDSGEVVTQAEVSGAIDLIKATKANEPKVETVPDPETIDDLPF
tara:strand:+ start:6114 stop:6779 length:666 start_codon:yes stop_codon:yes gene_type:complete